MILRINLISKDNIQKKYLKQLLACKVVSSLIPVQQHRRNLKPLIPLKLQLTFNQMQLREILSINTYKGKMVQKPKLKAILKLNLIMIRIILVLIGI